jgi:hypothetical protein
MQNQPVTFTAAGQCLTQITYTWIFTDPSGVQTTATGAQVSKTFPVFGPHQVQLTTSAPGYGSQSYVDKICVNATSLNMSLSVSPNNTIYQCSVPSDSGVRIFSAQLLGIPMFLRGWTFHATWVVKDFNDVVIGGGTSTDGRFTFPSPGKSYRVFCTATVMPNKFTNEEQAECYKQIVLGTQNISVTYFPEPQCP